MRWNIITGTRPSSLALICAGSFAIADGVGEGGLDACPVGVPTGRATVSDFDPQPARPTAATSPAAPRSTARRESSPGTVISTSWPSPVRFGLLTIIGDSTPTDHLRPAL